LDNFLQSSWASCYLERTIANIFLKNGCVVVMLCCCDVASFKVVHLRLSLRRPHVHRCKWTRPPHTCSSSHTRTRPRIPGDPSFRCKFHKHFRHSFYARSISQKCKKIQLSHQNLFMLSGSALVKAVPRMFMKFSPGVNFTNMFTQSFWVRRSQKRKKTVKSTVSFCAFEICAGKSCL